MPAPAPRASKLDPVTVVLSGVGRITVGQQQLNLYDFENLVDGWARTDRTRPIIVAPEPGSSATLLKDVKDVCRDYGLSNVTVVPAAKP
jgi:hypothetical protein